MFEAFQQHPLFQTLVRSFALTVPSYSSHFSAFTATQCASASFTFSGSSQKPFQDKGQLLLNALAGLTSDDRMLVQKELGKSSHLERDTARIIASRGRNQTQSSNRWIIGMRKIVCLMMQFAPVVDVAVNVQGDILSLPWAGIRSLLMCLQVAQKVHEQSESTLKGSETALDTSYLLREYFDIYSQLYGLILKFLANVHETCVMNRLERVERIIHTLAGDVIPNFKADHDRTLKTVESHARVCDLEVSEGQRTIINEQLKTLRKTQEEINEGMKGTQQTLDLRALPIVDGASCNSIDYRNGDHNGELKLCLDGTRVQIGKRIMDWATTADDQRVFWLSGMAGTGSRKIAAASDGVPPVDERPLTSQATDVRVIVIDALDECEEWGAIGNAMTLWHKLRAHTSMNLRVIVTSRSDNKIGDKLKQIDSEDLQHAKLEHLQSSTIRHDLALFCYNELSKIREKSREDLGLDELEDAWPGEIVVNKLVDISQPLFIAASTILRDVNNNPRQQSRKWVGRLNFTGAQTLTVIYSEILEEAADLDKEWLSWFSKVIQSLALLQSPLSIPALTDLLGDGDNMVVPNALKPLSSVIESPSGKEMRAGLQSTARIYHESSRDFLLDPNLMTISRFWTDQEKTHVFLLNKCMKLLKHKLGRDVCKRKGPGTDWKSTPSEHVYKHIPESVQYACVNWASHATQSNQTIQDGGQSFFADALRWLPAHRITISGAPLQTYLPALVFAPNKSIVRNSFKQEVDDFLQVWSPVESDWGLELQTLKMRVGYMWSIAPSIDGKRLVTALDDGTIRLWNVQDCAEEGCLEIVSRGVASSPSRDNLSVITGANGGLMKLQSSEEPRRIDLKLPGRACCVSVSPDGRFFAARGLDTGGIYIWHADNNPRKVIQGHNSQVHGMAFSSENGSLVSGFTDIWIWSAKGGHEMMCQVDADVEHIVISPDGTFVDFYSECSIFVLYCETREVERIMEGIWDPSVLTFTPDGQKVLITIVRELFLYAFGTKSKPIKLSLDDRVGSFLYIMAFSPDGKTTWAGYSDGVVIQFDTTLLLDSQRPRAGDAAVALSTDGLTLSALSRYSQLSLWNTETQSCTHHISHERLHNFHNFGRHVLISSDSRSVVVAGTACRQGQVVLIWNPETDELKELEEIPGHITATAISVDSRTLLCGSKEGQIYAYELKSGVRPRTSTVHTRSIREIVCSPTGQDFASLSGDEEIKMWSLQSQNPLTLGDKATILKSVFSADVVGFSHLILSTTSVDGTLKKSARSKEDEGDQALAKANVSASTKAPQHLKTASFGLCKHSVWELHGGSLSDEPWTWDLVWAENGRSSRSDWFHFLQFYGKDVFLAEDTFIGGHENFHNATYPAYVVEKYQCHTSA
ncbi:hypothetical protein K470DRAFT_266105 [Piedraia hortae CBS 480.64]|uniref:Mitochondrial division protein 1 n=1 Tax=Piedraia hortae CBS 480.64 TaxID=1314780 RepID=A0A6A7BSY6_9PEZI|nr:hypothetical protein K470DRAFT_266105 [Piedraia hortae CBS 480.64]